MIHPDQIAQSVLSILAVQSIYVLVLFPLVWGLVKCCRGKYPRWQHGLWLLILIRLVLPPDTAIPWSAGHLIQSIIPPTASRQLLAFPNDSVTSYEPNKGPVSSNLDNPKSNRGKVSREAPSITSRAALVPKPTQFQRFCLIICCAYFSIVIIRLVLFLRTRHRFWKIAAQGTTVQNPQVLNIIQNWRKRLHIRRRIETKTVAVDVPIYTIGIFRPAIILPAHLIQSAKDEALETVLAHELVHVKRLDDLAICLQELVRIAYFFHPLIWFVMPRLRWTREAVCDLTVLSHGTLLPRTYGRQLLALGQKQAFHKPSPKGLPVFTSAARGMAFRLDQIKKEDNMGSKSFIIYPTILILGLFLLPMAPMASSDQGHNAGYNTLSQYILKCVPCKNPEDVSQIIWGDLIEDDFQEEDFSHLVSLTDCDIVDNIGNGQKAYVFYLLSGSRRGVYRPSFHFIKENERLVLLFKTRNLSTYATNRLKINGRYEIEEGWRADLFDGIDDDRVNLAWGSTVWFWTGKQYVKAYTDYTIKGATDPSLLGTQRQWEKDTQSLYEAALRN